MPTSLLDLFQTDKPRRHVRKGQLKTTLFHGSNRGKSSGTIFCNDVVFTTYETLRSDWQGRRLLHGKPWLRVILDEGKSVQYMSVPGPPGRRDYTSPTYSDNT